MSEHKAHESRFSHLEVAGRNSDIVFSAGVVELSQAPVDEAQLPLFVVDHHIVGLDVAVHDAIRVRELEGNKQFVDVVANVRVCEGRVQDFEIRVVDMLKDQARSLGLRIAHNVKQLNDVGSPAQVLQDFYLSTNLLLLDWLQDLDHTARIIHHVDSFKHLTVLAPADLPDDFVVLLIPVSAPRLRESRIYACNLSSQGDQETLRMDDAQAHTIVENIPAERSVFRAQSLLCQGCHENRLKKSRFRILPPFNSYGLIIPILLWPCDIDVGIHSGLGWLSSH
jgi:hypothetical protein